MVGGTDIGLEKRRKRNPISKDAAESRYWRSCGLQAVCGSQPDLQRIGNTVRNAGQYSAVRLKQRVCKTRRTLCGCRIFRRSGQGQIAADPLKI